MDEKGFSSRAAGTRKRRFTALGTLIVLSFTVYAVYLFGLQIVNGLEYQKRAKPFRHSGERSTTGTTMCHW